VAKTRLDTPLTNHSTHVCPTPQHIGKSHLPSKQPTLRPTRKKSELV
jgi:hypothetical protein